MTLPKTASDAGKTPRIGGAIAPVFANFPFQISRRSGPSAHRLHFDSADTFGARTQ